MLVAYFMIAYASIVLQLGACANLSRYAFEHIKYKIGQTNRFEWTRLVSRDLSSLSLECYYMHRQAGTLGTVSVSKNLMNLVEGHDNVRDSVHAQSDISSEYSAALEQGLLDYLRGRPLSFWMEKCGDTIHLSDILWALGTSSDHVKSLEEIVANRTSTTSLKRLPLEVCLCTVSGITKTFVHMGLLATFDLSSPFSIFGMDYPLFRARYPECVEALVEADLDAVELPKTNGMAHGAAVQKELLRLLDAQMTQDSPRLKEILEQLASSPSSWSVASNCRQKSFVVYGDNITSKALVKMHDANDKAKNSSMSFLLSKSLGLSDVMVASADLHVDHRHLAMSEYISFLPENVKQEWNSPLSSLSSLKKLVYILAKGSRRDSIPFSKLALMLGWSKSKRGLGSLMGWHEEDNVPLCSVEEAHCLMSWLENIPSESIEIVALIMVLFDVGDFHDGNLVLYYDAGREALNIKIIDYDTWFEGVFETINLSEYFSFGRLPQFEKPLVDVAATLSRLDRANVAACKQLLPTFPFDDLMQALKQQIHEHPNASLNSLMLYAKETAYAALSKSYEAAGDHKWASSLYTALANVFKSQKRHKQEADTYIHVCRLFVSAGLLIDARHYCEEAASVYADQGMQEAAAASYERIIELCKDAQEYHLRFYYVGKVAELLASQGKLAEAAERYERSAVELEAIGYVDLAQRARKSAAEVRAAQKKSGATAVARKEADRSCPRVESQLADVTWCV